MTDHRSIDVAGIRLAYQVAGPMHAPPLVLLHGLGEGAADWGGVLPALARDRRVHAVDLRGHGDSDWPGDYSLELLRDDVLGFLDALGLERVDLVGHSLGGVVAYLVAAEQPGRVARLVLEDVPLPRPRVPTPPIRPEGPLAFDWQMVLALRKQLDTPPVDWLERLGAITAATLVLVGGPDSHIPQDGVAELARTVRNGRLVTIPAGHLIHATAPEAFLAAVLDFLPAAG
ncbi:alpha/beta fold hydrolase [Streptacidiphilus sp. MAP5-3]|uniref:alpha/beta fold hydrolase n=1 Tax=unclassified Streptacidiphilus TaxID=2643834 RepID=UPI003516E01D